TVKYSALNHLPSSALMQIGKGPAILTLSVTVTSIHLKSSRRRRQPHVRQQRESTHCSHRTLCRVAATRAAEVQAHDSGFGGGPASKRPKRRSFNPSRTSRALSQRAEGWSGWPVTRTASPLTSDGPLPGQLAPWEPIPAPRIA